MSQPVLVPPASTRRHVHVVGPASTADLTLPGDRTVGDLLPEIVDLVGSTAAAGPGTAWVLRRGSGALLPGNVEVAETGLVDGDVVRLEYWDPTLADPTVDDLPAELAEVTASLPDPLPARVLLPAWGVVLAWAVAAWLLVLRTGVVSAPGADPVRLVTCAGVLAAAVTVGTAVRAWRARADATPPRDDYEVVAALPLWAVVGALLPTAGAVPTAAAVAATLGAGALALLAATRGRSRAALAAAALALPWSVVAGIGVGVGLAPVPVAAVVAGTVALLLPAAPVVVGWSVHLAGDPSRPEITRVATATVGRVAAVHAGLAVAGVLTWPVLLPAGGAVTALGMLSATGFALAAVRRGVGTDTAVTGIGALAGLTALVAVATVALTAAQGPAVGVACPVVVAVLAARVARLGAGRRAVAAHRLGTLQLAVHAALPAVLLTVLGGYGAVRALAERVG